MADLPENLEERIAEIIVERLFLPVEPSAIGVEESLTIKHGVDSVRLFDMVVGMEDDFEVSFEDDELTIENFDSIAKIATSIRAKAEA
ncbi:MAG: acyl carrier protein [Planctomycetota bacterium]|jgi:acyl carrier protein